MFEESGGAMSGQAVAKKDCALEKRISDSDCRIGYHQRHFQSTYIVTRYNTKVASKSLSLCEERLSPLPA
jgi:hypothetical protein